MDLLFVLEKEDRCLNDLNENGKSYYIQEIFRFPFSSSTITSLINKYKDLRNIFVPLEKNKDYVDRYLFNLLERYFLDYSFSLEFNKDNSISKIIFKEKDELKRFIRECYCMNLSSEGNSIDINNSKIKNYEIYCNLNYKEEAF